jgi:hypothetical protein
LYLVVLFYKKKNLLKKKNDIPEPQNFK